MKRQLYNISTVGMTCQRSKPARSLPSTGMPSLAVPGRVWLTVSRFSPASSIQSFFRCRNRLMLSKESPDLLHRDNNQRGRKHFTPERHPALSRSGHARLGEPATAEYRRHGDDWAPGGRTFSGTRYRRCDHRWDLLDLYLPELWHHVTCGPSPRRKRFQGVWRDLFPCSLPFRYTSGWVPQRTSSTKESPTFASTSPALHLLLFFLHRWDSSAAL